MKRNFKAKWALASSFGFILTVLLLASFLLTPPGYTLNNEKIGLKKYSSEETLKEIPLESKVKVDSKEFSYREIGFSRPNDVDIPRAMNISKWGGTQKVRIKEPSQESLNKKLYGGGMNTVQEPGISFDGKTWRLQKGSSGREVKPQDFNGGTATDVKSRVVSPTVSNEKGELKIRNMLKNINSSALYHKGKKLYSIDQKELNSMVSFYFSNGEIKYKVNEQQVLLFSRRMSDEIHKNPKDGTAIVDEKGKILKKSNPWSTGYSFSEEKLMRDIKKSFLRGDFKVSISGDELKPKVDKNFNRAVVDKSERLAHFYSNGELVYSFPIAIGKKGTETDSGNFRVHSQVRKQDMGCNNPNLDYCTKNVPWITYYNDSEGFHGTYWHSDFGNKDSSMKSHGCVNMRIPDSKTVYKFLQVGSPVLVKD